jgi:hypothetical protein
MDSSTEESFDEPQSPPGDFSCEVIVEKPSPDIEEVVIIEKKKVPLAD